MRNFERDLLKILKKSNSILFLELSLFMEIIKLVRNHFLPRILDPLQSLYSLTVPGPSSPPHLGKTIFRKMTKTKWFGTVEFW